jgi:hypothetical protein
MHAKFWSVNLKGRDHSEDLHKDGWITLKWILGNGVGACGLYIYLAQDRGQGLTLVNTVIALQVEFLD